MFATCFKKRHGSELVGSSAAGDVRFAMWKKISISAFSHECTDQIKHVSLGFYFNSLAPAQVGPMEMVPPILHPMHHLQLTCAVSAARMLGPVAG